MSPRPSIDAAAHRPAAATGERSAPDPVAGDVASGDPAADPAADASRLLAGLADALARWFGPYGYHALLTRALAQARGAHPALAAVCVRGPLAPVLDGLDEAVRTHGGEATGDAVDAVAAGVVDLLGRVIGEDMVLQLLARGAGGPGPAASDRPTPATPARLTPTSLTADAAPEGAP